MSKSCRQTLVFVHVNLNRTCNSLLISRFLKPYYVEGGGHGGQEGTAAGVGALSATTTHFDWALSDMQLLSSSNLLPRGLKT